MHPTSQEPQTMSFDLPKDHSGIDGVYVAHQKRSIEMRDAYIDAGITLLNKQRLHELRIPDLAQHCGYSVGSFYTRFEDKEAFFRALQAAVVARCNGELERRLAPERLARMPVGAALDELVEVMADIFTSPGRGVIRESLLRILEPDGSWTPMRASGRRVVRLLHTGLAPRFPGMSCNEAQVRLSFCYQVVVGTLINDLVNDYLVFSTRDRSLRDGLKEMLRRYVGLRRPPRTRRR